MDDEKETLAGVVAYLPYVRILRVNLTKSGAMCHLYYAHTQFDEHLKLRYFDG